MKLRYLILLIAVAGCSSRHLGSKPSPVSGDAVFSKLADEFLTGYMEVHPLDAMQLGFHDYDGKLGDYSRAASDKEVARLKKFDRLLDEISTPTMSELGYFDLRVLRAGIRRDLFNAQERDLLGTDPMIYAEALDVSPYIKRDFKPLNERVRDIISILNQAPKLMAAARANLRASLPKPFVETAIEVGDGSAEFLEKDLVAALKDLKDEKLRAEFSASDEKAVAEVRAFIKYLKEEKLPRATGHFALGRRNFAKMLREGELITQSPEEILQIGEEELKREQAFFAETAAQIDPTRKAIEVFHEIQNDHPTAEGLIPDTRKDLEAIRQFVIDKKIVTIPSAVRPRVEETLPFERASTFASMDSPGPFESKATEAYYYVTPVEASWTPQEKEDWLRSFNFYTSDVVSIHEVYPGHYVQFLFMKASSATPVEKILGSYAYIEGWAHYCEQMMIDEGYGHAGPVSANQPVAIKAAKYRLAQLDESMLRLCRLCVAIKMHCQGMTVEEATKFFEDNCYYGEKPAHSEAMRGTFDPGYANYTLGKLMILKLRRDYQTQEGAGYSLEKFHDELLSHGMPPLPLLRELMLKDPRQWSQAL